MHTSTLSSPFPINYSYILLLYLSSWQISVGTTRNPHFWSSLFFNCSSQTLKHWILLTNSKAYPKLQHVSSNRWTSNLSSLRVIFSTLFLVLGFPDENTASPVWYITWKKLSVNVSPRAAFLFQNNATSISEWHLSHWFFSSLYRFIQGSVRWSRGFVELCIVYPFSLCLVFPERFGTPLNFQVVVFLLCIFLNCLVSSKH